MTIVADEGYLKGDNKKLGNNQFRKKEKDFGGLVLYNTMNGLFLNGYRYQNGYVTGKISTGKAANFRGKTSKGNTVSVLLACDTWKITTFYEDSTDYYTAGGYLYDTQCSYRSEVSFVLDCNFVYNVGGGTTSPPTIDPGPDDPCGGGGNVSKVNPTISVALEDVPCDEEPIQISKLDALVRAFCSNMTQSLKLKVEAVLNEYITGSGVPIRACIQAFVYNRLISLPLQNKFSICMDPNKAQGAFNASTLTLTFQNEFNIDSRILAEELFHAYQNSFYAGGIAQYGEVGFSNIEFEHALFRDITVGSDFATAMSPMNNTNLILQDEYRVWLRSITLNDTKFPTSFTAEQEAKYFYFLDKFRGVWAAYNKPVNPNLKPKAMFDVFNKTSCK